ncbi:hypothetical protein E6O75_ATG02501 [Venturia nashicola]|uniref:Uncharacterized protein n=1 Tax=Venturia nashicola TaxID=86259 RepID=A0A4Z1PFM9_9PEZI|nr:hypothetical protein E6O75_ATG02501 [Venturia nashicola]
MLSSILLSWTTFLALTLTGSANPILPTPLTTRGECGHCDVAFQQCIPVQFPPPTQPDPSLHPIPTQPNAPLGIRANEKTGQEIANDMRVFRHR